MPSDARPSCGELSLIEPEAAEVEGDLSSVLSEFARTMLTDFPIQAILDHLVQRIVYVLPITGAGVTLITPSLRPEYAAASDTSAFYFEELQSELCEGPCLSAYQSVSPVLVPDLLHDPRFPVFGPKALRIGLAAVFAFPLRRGSQSLGALDLYRDVPGGLSTTDLRAAQTLADVTAAYLVNAQARADLQEASDRSHQRSVHDALTGLPNRVLLIERIEHAIVRSGRSRKLVAALLVDLDHFEEINDRHGHRVGDELLMAVAERLVGLLRPGDTVARLAGDQFVILCEELDWEKQVAAIASRVVDAMSEPFVLGEARVTVAGSVGIAFACQTNHDPERLLHAAGIAMREVKCSGGGNHQVVDLRPHDRTEEHMDLRVALGKAEERGELRLAYQPIVRTDSQKLQGVEALLRWDHPVRGAISPSTVIPLAEQSGLIVELGRWVLEQACLDRKLRHRSDALILSVNVSAHQLMSADFVAMVATILSDTETDPRVVTFEITEGALVRDTQRAHIVLDQLKALGVLLALDDFGTGYSSLSYLKQFPVDMVKIDQTFVKDVVRDKSSHAIVSKTIELAHLLDLPVVCEGIETKEQHEALVGLKSDLCQGFYFGRPMSSSLLGNLVAQP